MELVITYLDTCQTGCLQHKVDSTSVNLCVELEPGLTYSDVVMGLLEDSETARFHGKLPETVTENLICDALTQYFDGKKPDDTFPLPSAFSSSEEGDWASSEWHVWFSLSWGRVRPVLAPPPPEPSKPLALPIPTSDRLVDNADPIDSACDQDQQTVIIVENEGIGVRLRLEGLDGSLITYADLDRNAIDGLIRNLKEARRQIPIVGHWNGRIECRS